VMGFWDHEGAEREMIAFCRAHLPKFMAPACVRAPAQDLYWEGPEVQAAGGG